MQRENDRLLGAGIWLSWWSCTCPPPSAGSSATPWLLPQLPANADHRRRPGLRAWAQLRCGWSCCRLSRDEPVNGLSLSLSLHPGLTSPRAHSLALCAPLCASRLCGVLDAPPRAGGSQAPCSTGGPQAHIIRRFSRRAVGDWVRVIGCLSLIHLFF